MDRIVVTSDDIKLLLEWRDQHPDKVRRYPAPLKAVEIIVQTTGWHIKGIRDGLNLRLHLNHNGRSLGYCEFRQRMDGMWESTKNRMRVERDDLQSVLTVYCSLMALMVYGNEEYGEKGETDRKQEANKPIKGRSKAKQQRTTYILRTVNGTLLAAPRGSHASPSGTFSVRGHYRHYKSGKVVWIAGYQKGTGKKRPKTYKIGGKQLDS